MKQIYLPLPAQPPCIHVPRSHYWATSYPRSVRANSVHTVRYILSVSLRTPPHSLPTGQHVQYRAHGQREVWTKAGETQSGDCVAMRYRSVGAWLGGYGCGCVRGTCRGDKWVGYPAEGLCCVVGWMRTRSVSGLGRWDELWCGH